MKAALTERGRRKVFVGIERGLSPFCKLGRGNGNLRSLWGVPIAATVAVAGLPVLGIRISLSMALLVSFWICFRLAMRRVHPGSVRELFPRNARIEKWDIRAVCAVSFMVASDHLFLWPLLLMGGSIVWVPKAVGTHDASAGWVVGMFSFHGIWLGLLAAFAVEMRKAALSLWRGEHARHVRACCWLAIFCPFLFPFGAVMGAMALSLQNRPVAGRSAGNCGKGTPLGQRIAERLQEKEGPVEGAIAVKAGEEAER